jgi:drug/metabolite transporter (DMT)-like permease|tara:strand:+ start:2552 stop:3406 length:855 start_codon:yes stop_codon:yes gene_type:complete
MIYLPILGAVALGAGNILEKIVLKRRKVNIKLYQTASFLAIILTMLPFVFFFWRMNTQALEISNILIFLLVIIFSLIANMFVFYSMKWEKLTNLEPAKILEPLFIIFLAIIFSFFIDSGLYEKNLNVIIPALIAGAALVFSHVKEHHLHFNKYFIAAILGSLFFALELVTSRLILDFYSPITFYFIRCSSIFLISWIAFRPNFGKLSKKVRFEILATGIIWVIYRLIVYYGYLNIGIIFTTLMIMLGPIFIYAFAYIFLKEKLNWRNITAAIIIVGSVLYATLA